MVTTQKDDFGLGAQIGPVGNSNSRTVNYLSIGSSGQRALEHGQTAAGTPCVVLFALRQGRLEELDWRRRTAMAATLP